jgi:hypothetical protein
MEPCLDAYDAGAGAVYVNGRLFAPDRIDRLREVLGDTLGTRR